MDRFSRGAHSLWSTVSGHSSPTDHTAPGAQHHAGWSREHRHSIDPATAMNVFHHYSDAQPAARPAAKPAGVGRPPKPMSHDELAYFLDDGPAKAPGVGRPPKPMSHDELAELLDDGPAKPAGVGRPPKPMSHDELAYFLE